MHPGLIAGQQAAVHLLLDDRVVFRDLFQAALAQAVGPAVAHLADHVARVREEGKRGEGGPHAALLLLTARPLQDLTVRLLHRLDEPAPHRLQVRSRVAEAAEGPAHFLRGHPGGDLARRVAAHPVGDQEDAVGVVEERGVLVHRSHAADVSASGADPLQGKVPEWLAVTRDPDANAGNCSRGGRTSTPSLDPRT